MSTATAVPTGTAFDRAFDGGISRLDCVNFDDAR